MYVCLGVLLLRDGDGAGAGVGVGAQSSENSFSDLVFNGGEESRFCARTLASVLGRTKVDRWSRLK